MASRRQLKKEVRYVISELINECLVAHCVVPDFDATKLDSLVGRIIAVNTEFCKRINAPEGTSNPKRTKLYYKTLINDFNDAVEGIINDMK